MTIVSKAAIREFGKEHGDALESLMHWYHVTKRARWMNGADIRQDFRHADFVGDHMVFNIAGNKYRLVAIVKYRWQVVYIRHIPTHSEYDKERWK